ncbi:type A2 lanthipeptide [Paenibacillus lentus]|uniref:Lantibiotic n=1 Tax=Paenibacillus lentus TaxID=1338368 RepID=A0A3S8RWB3_9BACL|nr:type A2 lanthipeptide [Paenibacillus lentus]AZK47306.1 type A2 lantipeptide [Paenibacillus lentus]
MNNLNVNAMAAIEDISDEELMVITGAAAVAASGGVICTISHECHYNSVSPAAWATCC